MTNAEKGNDFLIESTHILEEAKEDLKKGAFNLVVRRSQEVVEICLKGFFKFIGVEYPKVHDVGEIFFRKVKEKCPDVNIEDLEKIRDISKRLTKEREPAFYSEKAYSKEEAEKAVLDAEYVLSYVEKLKEKWEKK